jgi:iron complex transport system substrate-binding protein
MKGKNVLFLIGLVLALTLGACAPTAAPVPTASAATAAVIAPTDVEATAVGATSVAPTTTAVESAATTAPTVSAAAEVPAAGGPVTVKDGDGQAFQLDRPAQRIISLAPSNTEILYAVGAGSQVIARDEFTNYPEEAKGLPSIGGSMGKYNLEEMTRLQPDLILASPITSADVIKSIRDLSLPIFVLPNPTDLDSMYANLATVGALTGRQTEAQALVNNLTARVSAVEEKVKGVTEKPKVFYELDATDPAKPWTSGPGTFMDTLITMAGGQNVGASLTGEYAQMSQEALIVENPDVILLGDALYGGITPEQVAARSGWNVIKAVQNHQVLDFNDDLVSRPGPRLVDGLEALAKVLHPELFQ